MPTLFWIIFATFFVSLVSLLTGFCLLRQKKFTQKYSFYLVGFSAGVLLSAAILDLLPEALSQKQNAGVYVSLLSGIMVFFFLERFVIWFHHHDQMHELHPSSFLVLLGDFVHNIFDGIAITAAFLINPWVGILTTLAITAHEIPHEIANLVILVHGGFSKSKALFFNFSFGLSAVAGAIIAFYFLKRLEILLPLSLAFTAGMFIYITCSDLIPELHQNSRNEKTWGQSLSFLLGIAVMWLLISFFS